MCDFDRSGIRGDTRKLYYCEVGKFSNIYGMQLVLDGEHGHKKINISLGELVWCAALKVLELRYGSIPPHR